ncbi:MAG TPA: hypothetical protein VN814_13130 [Caulobacteraceae bacterium]|nr:hypothetical protein [Caulobacteraceae bacterium]
MRRLDWFLAAIVATFLLAVAAIETTNLAIGAVGFGVAHAGSAGEVAMRRLVSHLPHAPILSADPQ